MKFKRTVLQEALAIRKLISFHYFEFAHDYKFLGERHPFWELLYVDKGEVVVTAGETLHVLKQGDIIFHKPDEFHTVAAGNSTAPNLVVISFECASPLMKHFEERMFHLESDERNWLAHIVREGFHAFHPPFDMPQVHTLNRRADAPPGSEQLIRLYMEMMLIGLVRKAQSPIIAGSKPLAYAAKEKRDRDLIDAVSDYMSDRLEAKLTIDHLCRRFNTAKTVLKTRFKEQTGHSPMEYFKLLKMERAKTLIREERCNFTEIAGMLGYSTVHYFSRDFKNNVNMTPSEYAKSVKARVASS